MQIVVPPAKWCTDNGVMVGWAGVERYNHCTMLCCVDVAVGTLWFLRNTAAKLQRTACCRALCMLLLQ